MKEVADFLEELAILATDDINLFVYGTLKNKHTEYTTLGHDVLGSEKAILSGYKKMHKGNDYYSIKKYEGPEKSNVPGKKLKITRKDLEELDDWEMRYNRIEVVLSDGTEAYAYQMPEDHTDEKIAHRRGPVRNEKAES